MANQKAVEQQQKPPAVQLRLKLMPISALEIDAIVCDVDGTLLDSRHVLHPKTRDALKRISKEIPVIISTGKQKIACRDIFQELEIDNHPSCHLNGSVVYVGDSIIHEVGLDADFVLNFIKNWNIYDLFLYTLDTVYHYGETLEFANVLRDGYGEPVCRAPENLTNRIATGQITIVKLCVCLKDKVKLKQLKQTISNNVTVTQALDFAFEIISKDASKGNALKHLMKYLKIDLERVICFGDGQNDVSMFAVAGHSCAMGNAMIEAKTAAKYTTCTNDEGGVGEFLYQIYGFEQ